MHCYRADHWQSLTGTRFILDGSKYNFIKMGKSHIIWLIWFLSPAFYFQQPMPWPNGTRLPFFDFSQWGFYVIKYSKNREQGRLIFGLLICNQRWFCEKCCHTILAKWSIWVCIWRSCQNNKFSSILTGMLVNRKMIFTQKWFFMSIEYCIIHIWILFLYKSENMAIKIALVMEKAKLVNFLPYLGLGFIQNEIVRYRYFQMFEFLELIRFEVWESIFLYQWNHF